MQQLSAVRGGESRATLAMRDVVDGIKAYPIWTTLAWQDIRQRYRRSVLGPFWMYRVVSISRPIRVIVSTLRE